jgi:YD repeat-containing protein
MESRSRRSGEPSVRSAGGVAARRARRAAGAFRCGLLGIGLSVLAGAASACPDGYECTSPESTEWCYTLSYWAGGTSPPACFRTEADALVFHDLNLRETHPACAWLPTIVRYPWAPQYCWNGYGGTTSQCDIVTSNVESVNTPSSTLSSNCQLDGGSTFLMSTVLTCPLTYQADHQLRLCKRARVRECPIANPISPVSGDKLQDEIDFVGGGIFPLTIRRHYSSAAADFRTDFGTGPRDMGDRWRTGFQRRIGVLPTIPGTAWVVPAGKCIDYFDLEASAWAPRRDSKGRLMENRDGGGNRVGWIYLSEADDVETYDASGRLQSIAKREGATQTLAYDADGRIRSVTDSFGRQLTFAYTGTLLTEARTPGGEVYRYAYDGNANLATVTAPGGSIRTYLYNESAYSPAGTAYQGTLTGIVDENGSRFATFRYAPGGRVVGSEHAGGADKWTVDYSSGTYTPTVVDPLGNARRFTYSYVSGAFRNTALSAPCTHCGIGSQATSYDVNGNVASRTDFNGRQSCHAYDTARNLETARVEGLLASESCASSLATLPARGDVRKVSTRWHAVWRLPAAIAEPSRLTSFVYNGDGGVGCAPADARVGGYPIGVLCRRTVQETTDATGQQGFTAAVTGTPRTWRYTYDAFGQVLTATDPLNRTTTTAYYAANDPDPGKRGNVQTVTNALGHVTTFTAYDANGRPTSITDPNGVVTNLTYHRRGWLASRSVGGEATNYDYDGAGQLTQVRLPDGSLVRYGYDAAHRLTQVQDGLGNRIAYTRDPMGNTVNEAAFDPGGTLARREAQVFDSLNRLHQRVGAQ